MKRQLIIKGIMLGLLTILGLVGYFTSDFLLKVSAEENDHYTVSIYKYKIQGDIPSDIPESSIGHTFPDGELTPLPGIIYELRLVKSDDATWDGPKVWRKATQTTTVENKTVAVVQFTDLPKGTYTYRELLGTEYALAHRVDNTLPSSLPTGVIPNPTRYQFKLPNAYLSNNEYRIFPKNQDGTGMIRIEKMLRKDPLSDSLTVMPNVPFKLYDKDYVELTKTPTTNQPLNLVTDSTGRLTITGLALGGTYYLKEVPPAGTIPEKVGYRKFIAKSSNEVADLSNDVTLEASPVTGQFINNTVQKQVKSNLNEQASFEKGSVVLTGQPFTYRLAARIPDKGNGVLTQVQLVDQMKPTSNGYYTYFETNDILTQFKQITVKVDETPLETNQYEIKIQPTDKQQIVSDPPSTQVVGFTLELTHPEDFRANQILTVEITAQLIKEAIVQETRTVYQNRVEESVTVKYPDTTSEHFISSDMANVRTERGHFRIEKQALANPNLKLAGAKFDLYSGPAPQDLTQIDSTKKIASDLITNGEGVYESKNDWQKQYIIEGKNYYLAEGLPLGEYYLVETQAPETYQTLSLPIPLTITVNNNENVTVMPINNRSTFLNVPDTGGMGRYILPLIGSVLLVGVALAYWQSRRLKDATLK